MLGIVTEAGGFFLTEGVYLPTFEIVALNEVGITRLSTSLVRLIILCEKKTRLEAISCIIRQVNASRLASRQRR